MLSRLLCVGLGVCLLAAPLQAQFFSTTTAYRVSGSVQNPPPLGFPLSEDLGSSLAVLGDLDGDGRDDLVAGAPDFVQGTIRVGRLVALDGETLTPLWVRTGSAVAQLGESVARIPDIDGDGIDDLVAGRTTSNPIAPRGVDWMSGADGSVIDTFDIVENAFGFGAPTVVPINDLNGDGEVEYAVASVRGTGNQALVRIISRTDGVVGDLAFPGSIALIFPARVAASVTADLTGDGVPDLVFGEPRASSAAPLLTAAGVVAAFDGVTLAPLWSRFGLAVTGSFGAALTTVPDVNGDGLRDLLVGQPGQNPNLTSGDVFLLDGATGALTAQVPPPVLEPVTGFGSSLLTVNADPNTPPEVVFIGVSGSFQPAGSGTGLAALQYSVVPGQIPGQTFSARRVAPELLETGGRIALAGPGDVNGDGSPDIVIGLSDNLQGGSVHVFRSRGVVGYGTLPPGAPLLGLGSPAGPNASAIQRLQGGTPMAPAFLAVGIAPASVSVLQTTLLVDLSSPATSFVSTSSFNAAGDAIFLLSLGSPLVGAQGLTVYIQGFDVLAGPPPALAASLGRQVTL